MADRGDPAKAALHRQNQTRQRSKGADEAEKTIVVRDRRKPNQYTTDNVIAREWLPILRVGDAFFFYSVYLSMANRETESSWGSLRTQAEYLQCSVDLIVRGNKLLEICELVHIETGNQYTSNQYYILDPPPLTDELQERIRARLDVIAQQETSKNWQSWVKQVRKALRRHRALPDIWAERRARRGGRPIKTLRPSESTQDRKNSSCEPQPGFRPDPGRNGKGARDSQPPWVWDTTEGGVRHTQGKRDSQPEQDILTNASKQGKERKEDSPLLVREWLTQLGVAEPAIDALEERYSAQRILRQLEWLCYRNPRDPAAMLISAVRDDWDPPTQVTGGEMLVDNERGALAAGQTLLHASSDASLQGESCPDALPLPESGSGDDNWSIEGTSVDVRDAWGQLLAEIRLQMTRVTFDTWLGGTQVAGVHGKVASVLVRDEYAADWLGARWRQPIERTLSGIIGCPVEVRFLSPDAEQRGTSYARSP
jgi:hypothetical protein